MPFAGVRKARGDRAGKPQGRGRVERHKAGHLIGALLDEAFANGRSGIVDEYPDAGIVAQPGFHRRQVGRLRKVGLKDVDRYAMVLMQTGTENFHSRRVPGNEHQIMPASREALGIGGADAGGGAGNEDGWLGSHGIGLSRHQNFIDDGYHQ